MELQSRALIMNVHSLYEVAEVALKCRKRRIGAPSVRLGWTDLFNCIFLCVMSAFSSSFLQCILQVCTSAQFMKRLE